MSLPSEWLTYNAELNGKINNAYGNHFSNLLAGTKIASLKFFVKRIGSPAGLIHARIGTHIQPNGTFLKAFGTPIAVDTISTSVQAIEFFDSYTLPSDDDYHIYIFFDGSHTFPTDVIMVEQYQPHTLGNDVTKTTADGIPTAFTDAGLNYFVVSHGVYIEVGKSRSQAILIG